MNWFLRALAFCGLLALVACGTDTAPEGITGTIEGSVLYRERMMLPPGAMIEVQLQDISRADALATVMETLTLPVEGGPPYAFAMSYGPENIDPRRRYALRASISLDDKLLFTTTEYIDPFAGNPLEIVVQRVAEPVRHSPGQ